MSRAYYSEFFLKLCSPTHCAQERLVAERNQRAPQVYNSFTEGSNYPLLKGDSLEESDALYHF